MLVVLFQNKVNEREKKHFINETLLRVINVRLEIVNHTLTQKDTRLLCKIYMHDYIN